MDVRPRPAPPLASPRLRRVARAAPVAVAEPGPEEHCDLCGVLVPAEHRHVLDTRSREMLCACRPCSLLFDRPVAANGHLRLVPDRRLALENFHIEDPVWEGLRIPVEMAFFLQGSDEGRVQAFYPSPMGATESRLGLESWETIARANPILATLQPDVEVLLVNRARGARRYLLVPIEDAFRLVAVIRTRWRGFTGGKEVWAEIDTFFADLDARARPFHDSAAEPVAERS